MIVREFTPAQSFVKLRLLPLAVVLSLVGFFIVVFLLLSRPFGGVFFFPFFRLSRLSFFNVVPFRGTSSGFLVVPKKGTRGSPPFFTFLTSNRLDISAKWNMRLRFDSLICHKI
jgi:hypothetical protein